MSRTTALVKSEPRKLERGDRCERCGAEAMVLAKFLDNGLEFLLCYHHLRASAMTFVMSGVQISGKQSQIFKYDQQLDFKLQRLDLLDQVMNYVDSLYGKTS